ncbi:MAG: tryptophan synthase subunit alpha [Acidobacteriota bacterium]
MSRLSEIFRRNSRCFIPFVTAGHPDLETTADIVFHLAARGAHLVELGIPFSDPIADGPIIQKSSFEALQHKYSLDDYLGLVREVRRRSDVGMIFMSYLNPLYNYGLERLDREGCAAGLDGVLISDLTPEAYERLGTELMLDTVFLAAPTSSEERLKKICAHSRGFVYLVARTGVTGGRTDIDALVPETVARLRRYTNLPICVGFGITSGEDVQRVWKYAEGAIVGSAIVKFIQEHKNEPDLAEKVGRYAGGFVAG